MANDYLLRKINKFNLNSDDAKPKFFGWMRSKGFKPAKQAAGNIYWKKEKTNEYIWLSSNCKDAIYEFVRCFTGHFTIFDPHGKIINFDKRKYDDILNEISSFDFIDSDKNESEKWTGGGLFVIYK